MYTLFLDTHDEFIKVALVNNDEVIIKEQESEKSHSIYIVPMIKEIMHEVGIGFSNIKNIVAVNGPGSFTGIRVGLSIAKTISYTKNIPIYLISSLTSLLVSDVTLDNKMAVIKDTKGYYISVFDKDNKEIVNECYKDNIDVELEKYRVSEHNYDVKKIVNFALNREAVNVFAVKANYVKQIEVMNDRA